MSDVVSAIPSETWAFWAAADVCWNQSAPERLHSRWLFCLCLFTSTRGTWVIYIWGANPDKSHVFTFSDLMYAPAWEGPNLPAHVLGLFRDFFDLYNVYLMKPSLQLSLFLYKYVEFNEDEGILDILFCFFFLFFFFFHFKANVGLIIHQRHRILKVVPADLCLH